MTRRAKAHLASQAEAVGAPPPDESRNTSETSLAALIAAQPSPSGHRNQFGTIKTLSVPEAGRIYFGLSRNGSYEAARRKEIPTIKIGRLLRVPVVLLDRMLESGQTPQMPE